MKILLKIKKNKKASKIENLKQFQKLWYWQKDDNYTYLPRFEKYLRTTEKFNNTKNESIPYKEHIQVDLETWICQRKLANFMLSCYQKLESRT